MLTQLNYLREKGVIQYDPNAQRYSANLTIFREGLRSLLHDFLMIQVKGDYDAAKEFLAKYGEVAEDVQRALPNLADIPIDIIPIFRLPFHTSWDVNDLAS